ncbi:MAG: [Fe-Fe] hydrogenase large subunit C-terminal domain-containing protein [Lentimicrobiaceae bacterium]|nr:[Fe-Fe] hydrogenase large subunit C-terminal domain-containing protein [Lentimicrobiaceae bacterium]
MEKAFFYHALKVDHQLCYGCSKCMNSCPTEAIRVKNGKAFISDNRCIDCGKCFEVCPVNAIYIKQDDFDEINNYKHRIALVPEVFFGQFPDRYSKTQICNAIMAIGFTNVAVAEISVPYLINKINEYCDKNKDISPIISSFCPAVVRLVQVKFPSLTPNILLLKTPLDVTAIAVKQELTSNNIPEEEIGLFYITPCAAKIAAVKSPVGEDISAINGVINMDTLFNKVYTYLKNNAVSTDDTDSINFSHNIHPYATNWPLTYGEASIIKGNNIAVDGIHNVIEFLEKVENEEIEGIDYIELRSCIESCAGGVLLTSNKFLISEKIKKSQLSSSAQNEPAEVADVIQKYDEFLQSQIQVDAVLPRNMMKLDEKIEVAMQKLDRISKIMKILPQIDCSVCGSPNCNAFASDIANHEAKLEQCIFIQRSMEQKDKLTPDKSYQIMIDIWGKNKFNKIN